MSRSRRWSTPASLIHRRDERASRHPVRPGRLRLDHRRRALDPRPTGAQLRTIRHRPSSRLLVKRQQTLGAVVGSRQHPVSNRLQAFARRHTAWVCSSGKAPDAVPAGRRKDEQLSWTPSSPQRGQGADLAGRCRDGRWPLPGRLERDDIYNPTWPPHAKFHNGQTMSMGAGLAAMTLWQLWRAQDSPAPPATRSTRPAWPRRCTGSLTPRRWPTRARSRSTRRGKPASRNGSSSCRRSFWWRRLHAGTTPSRQPLSRQAGSAVTQGSQRSGHQDLWPNRQSARQGRQIDRCLSQSSAACATSRQP